MTDVLITPASGKIEFFDATDTLDAKIELDAFGNLNITSPGGDISIGDTTADVYIGDGINNIDIVFEQNGAIRGLTGVTLTLGAADSFVQTAAGLTVNGNLTVNGTTTTINTETINLADNIIVLNSNETGTPSQNAGIEIERGTSANVVLQWNETSDHWEIASGGTTGRILTTGDEGSGNGIDADTVDGIQAASFLRSNANDDFSGTLNYTPDTGTVLAFDGQAILRRLNADGALAIGHDSALIMGGGEAIDSMVANLNPANEVVYIGAEGGVTFYAFPANNTTWSNRKEMVYDTNGNLTVPGQLNAITKSFVIDHPTKPGMKLRYGSLEGPENGVYVRGRLTGSNTIELPDYWVGLVHEDSITVNLTPIGRKHVWIESIDNNIVSVGCDEAVDCFYTIFAERKDVDKLEVEYDI